MISCRPTRTFTRQSSRLLGDTGRKIHAGRSRNDQVAAALRLYVEDACAEALRPFAHWQRRSSSGLTRAPTPMPGYTHLQRAQPVTVGHHLLAWVEMLERDLVRFQICAGPGTPVAARLGRAQRRLHPAAAAAPRPAAKLARRRRRPGLRARLPLRVRAPPLASLPASGKSCASGRPRSSSSSISPWRPPRARR